MLFTLTDGIEGAPCNPPSDVDVVAFCDMEAGEN
jgi:hypothetical protein